MMLESMEQRVANTPAVLLCDECLKRDCCKWVDEMKTAVVNTDKSCYGRPFKPEAWTCSLYLPSNDKYDVEWGGIKDHKYPRLPFMDPKEALDD